MNEYCRFCAEKKENLINITEKDVSYWFTEIINQDLHTNINENCLSTNICYSCLCKIEDFNYFIKKCRVSLLRLEEIWKNNSTSENKPSVNCLKEEEISEPELDKDTSNKDNLDDKIINDNKTTKVKDNKISCLKYKFKCQECSKTFEFFNDLQTHKKSHKISYLCPKCGDITTNKVQFYYHMRKHGTENSPFVCDYCSKSFMTQSLLKSHRFKHTGGDSESHECGQCGKKCRSAYELKVHTRFHTQLRQYKCEICSKAFVVKTHLKQHMVTHTGERKYVCKEPGCNKSYTTASALKRHNDYEHLPDYEKKFSCEYCLKKYSMQFLLKDHIRASHKKLINASGHAKLKRL